MPFYEYECSNCRFYVEVLQKISEEPLKKCPSCGKKALKKLVSAPVFRLKGSGWYETDFKSDQEGKRNLAGAEKEDSSSDSKAEAKPADADKKPDAKADAKSEAKPADKPEASAAKGEKRSDTAKATKSKSRGSGQGSGKGSAKTPAKKRSAPRPKASAKRRRGR